MSKFSGREQAIYIRHMLTMLPAPDTRLFTTLTPWERKFLTDVRARVAAGQDLTEGQLDKLLQVYQERNR